MPPLVLFLLVAVVPSALAPLAPMLSVQPVRCGLTGELRRQQCTRWQPSSCPAAAAVMATMVREMRMKMQAEQMVETTPLVLEGRLDAMC